MSTRIRQKIVGEVWDEYELRPHEVKEKKSKNCHKVTKTITTGRKRLLLLECGHSMRPGFACSGKYSGLCRCPDCEGWD